MAGTYEEIIDGCKLEISSKASGVLARINIDLVSPPVIIKGFTLKEGIDKEGNAYKQLSAPSYKGKFKYHPNIWMPEELWKMLSSKVIAEYEKLANTEEAELIDLDKVKF